MDFGLNLQSLFDKHKTDDGYNVEEVRKEVMSQVNGYVEKQKPELMKQVEEDVVNKFITSQKIEGVENVEQFKAHVKRMGSNASELSEENSTLSKELEDLKQLKETLETTNNDLTKQVTGYKRNEVISSKGFNAKYSKAVILEAESRMTEDVDFEKALDSVKEEFPEFLSKVKKGGKTPNNDDFTPDEEKENMRKALGLT